jgi:hypothetical protein
VNRWLLLLFLALTVCTADASRIVRGVRVSGGGGGGSGQIAVTWVAPAKLADGTTSATGTLTGYTVYWDTTPGLGSYSANSHFVSGESTLTYTITSLTSGTYYVSVTATGAQGEGDPDNQRLGVVIP